MTPPAETAPVDIVNLYKAVHPKDLGKSEVEKKFPHAYRQPVRVTEKSVRLDRGAFSQNFTRLFEDLKAREGTSARQFAQDINVGEDQVSRWRSGTAAVPGLGTILKIAGRFGVSVDVLLIGVFEGYAVPKTVQYETSKKNQNMRDSALPATGSAHARPTVSATHLLHEIEARERILELTRKDIHDLTRRLYETRDEGPRPIPAKPVARTVRRNGRR